MPHWTAWARGRTRSLRADKEHRGGAERAASYMCAASERWVWKKKADAGTRRALLARRGVRNVEAIEELLEQGEFDAACASE